MSNESVIESCVENESVLSLCVEQPSEIANDVSRVGQSGGLELKNQLHYSNTEDWPLPGSLGTDRRGRPASGEPLRSVSTRVRNG